MELKTFSSSSPQNEWDSWYSETHKGTKATWEDEIEIDEDVDIVDYDKMEDEDE